MNADYGQLVFVRSYHPEMGDGVEIVQADPAVLIDLRLFAAIGHRHHHWADLDAYTGILHLNDDFGHRYVYKCTGFHCVNGVDYVVAKWPD
jgi:hypothetical protein